MRYDICQLTKTLEYLKIQESLRCKNLIEYYLCNGILLCFSLLWKILYKYEVKQINEVAKT